MKSQPIPLTGLSELVRELEARIERHPNYPDLRNLRGAARAYLRDLDGALADVKAALGVNPKYEAALLNLAWIHSQRRDGAALAAFLGDRRTQGLSPARQTHLRFLERLGAQGEQAALALLESQAPSSLAPLDGWLELDRLWLLWRVGRWEMLEAQMARILAWLPGLAEHFRATGMLRAGERGREAFGVWGACYDGNPQVAGLLREAARIRAVAGSGMTWEALLHWSAVLSLDLCDYWLAVGWHHDFDGRDAEAELAFRRAAESDAARAQPRIKLGLLYSACGRPQDAVRELDQAAALEPHYPDVRYMLGLLHKELGRADDAEVQFRAALGIHSRYTMARLALGCLLEAQHRDAEALQLLEGVCQAGVVSADLEMRLAALYERLGRAQEAKRARTRAQKLVRARS
jgi:tetratricopeptide (TPR) repeat protein